MAWKREKVRRNQRKKERFLKKKNKQETRNKKRCGSSDIHSVVKWNWIGMPAIVMDVGVGKNNGLVLVEALSV